MPIIYLLLAWMMEHWRWVETYEGAAHPWDVPTVRGMVGGLAVTLLLSLAWFRVRRTFSLRRPETDQFGPLRFWTRQFYLMVTFSDALAFLGLIYFFVSGRLWALFVGGALAYLGYALTYPTYGDLDRLRESRP